MNKFLLTSLLVVVLLILVGVTALPSLLSTEWGKQKLTSYIKKIYKVDASCAKLSLRWFGPQEITQLVVDNPPLYHFDCAIIKTEATLLDILFKREMGHLYFDRPFFQMASHLHTTALPVKREKKNAPEKKQQKSASLCPFSLPFTGRLICCEGKLLFHSEINPISFDAVQCELQNDSVTGMLVHLSCDTVQNETQGSLQLDATCTPKESWNAKIDITDLPMKGVDEILSLFYPPYAGLATETFGRSMNLSLQANSANALLSLSASSPLSQIDVSISTQNETLALKEPAELVMTMTPALIQRLVTLYPLLTPLTLCQNTSLQATLTEFSGKDQFQGKVETTSPLILTWNETVLTADRTLLEYKKSSDEQRISLQSSLTTVQGEGSLSIASSADNIQLTLDLPQIKLEEIELKKKETLYTLQKPTRFSSKELKGEIASLSIDTRAGYKVNMALPTFSYGPISVHTSELDLDYNPKQKRAKLDFSTHAQGENALALIGETLSFSLFLDQKSSSFSLSSPLVQIQAPFAVQKGIATLLAPGKTQWKLTPQGYRVLEKVLTGRNTLLTLKETTTLQGNLSTCRLPLTPLDLSQLECSGELTDPSLLFWDPRSKDSIALSGLMTSWKVGKKAEPITFKASLHTQDKGSTQGRLSLQGEFDEKHNIQLALECKQFPSRLLDIGRADLPFSKSLGSYFDANLTTTLKQFSGPITVTLQAPQLHFSLKGGFSNGTLLLSEPMQAQMKVTKEMSQLFLKKANPLSLTYFYSHAPVRLTIPAKGFSLPCQPLSFEQASIPSARIELGKIACRNEGNIHIALGLLKQPFDNDQELLLWFAPLDLHLSKSILSIERTEILLANTFDIALWGDLSLSTQDVDMVLGLTTQTLRKAFGIKNLPEEYVLTIPMTGKTDNVKINTSKATTKIALLLAAQQKALTPKEGKGGKGALIGGFLQQMAILPDNEKVPPAKHPFPWE